jgi:hypothetical protein
VTPERVSSLKSRIAAATLTTSPGISTWLRVQERWSTWEVTKPSADAQTTAQNQIGIVRNVRAAGFSTPSVCSLSAGQHQPTVVISALRPASSSARISLLGTESNGAAAYVQSDLQQAKALEFAPSSMSSAMRWTASFWSRKATR